MKRRFFALLAVPALALSLVLASLGTDEAQAYPQVDPFLVCSIAKWKIDTALHYGDEASAGEYYDMAIAAGCDRWSLV